MFTQGCWSVYLSTKKPRFQFLKGPTAEFVKSALIVAAAAAVLALLVVFGYANVESLWFDLSLSGIRISTLASAFVCFGLVLFMQRRSTLKSVYYAVLAVIVPMAAFEIMWYYSAMAFRGWDPKIMQFAALFGWVLLGIAAVIHTKPSKTSLLFYAAFVVVFAVWIATGFHFNDLGNPTFNVSAEVFNVVSKGALFFAYAFHVGKVGRAYGRFCQFSI
jgi:hypothetical protein